MKCVNSVRPILFYLTCIFALAACTTDGLTVPVLQLDTSTGQIDLAQQLPGNWEAVCVITPYATTEFASEVVGFEYKVESFSNISDDDSISLLVTTAGNEVVGQYEVKRKNADFANLGADCYLRDDARFSHGASDDGDWNVLKHT
jgi:hypothetical protein